MVQLATDVCADYVTGLCHEDSAILGQFCAKIIT